MLRHAGIAAGDALARNAARATGARSRPPLLCVPIPDRRRPEARPALPVGFLSLCSPDGRGRRPGLARPPRVSLAPTAGPEPPASILTAAGRKFSTAAYGARAFPASRPDPRAQNLKFHPGDSHNHPSSPIVPSTRTDELTRACLAPRDRLPDRQLKSRKGKLVGEDEFGNKYFENTSYQSIQPSMG